MRPFHLWAPVALLVAVLLAAHVMAAPVGQGVAIAPTGIPMYGLGNVKSTATEASKQLCAGPCNLYNLTIVIGATSGYLMLFDALSVPADGAVTPDFVWPVTSNATNGGTALAWGPGPPFAAGTGLQAVFSTTGPFTKTGSATAAFFGAVQTP